MKEECRRSLRTATNAEGRTPALKLLGDSEFFAVQAIRTGARKLEDKLLSKPIGPIQIATRITPLVSEKSESKILRQRLTMALKARRKLEQEAKAHRAGLRVIKWAVRYVNGGGDWAELQLERAVNALERIEP